MMCLCVKIIFPLYFLKKRKIKKEKRRVQAQALNPYPQIGYQMGKGSNKRLGPFMNPITYNKGFGLVGSEEKF